MKVMKQEVNPCWTTGPKGMEWMEHNEVVRLILSEFKESNKNKYKINKLKLNFNFNIFDSISIFIYK